MPTNISGAEQGNILVAYLRDRQGYEKYEVDLNRQKTERILTAARTA